MIKNSSFLVFSVLLWLTACTAAATPTPQLAETAVLPTSIPSVTPNPTNTPTPEPTPTPDPCALNPVEGIKIDATTHDVILFMSSQRSPLANMGNIQPMSVDEYTPNYRLWAISTDGLQAGYLKRDEGSTDWLLPAIPFLQSSITATNHIPELDNETKWFPSIPQVCTPPAEPDERWKSCRDFDFSPDGKWLLFKYGQTSCGRQRLGYLDLETGQFKETNSLMSVIKFLPNGSWLVESMHCEGGNIDLFNPETNEWMRLGSTGDMIWNSDETAFAVIAHAYVDIQEWIWGYNIETMELFVEYDGAIADRLAWTPDGSHLLYQYRPITTTRSITFTHTLTYGVSQIRRVGVDSGDMNVIASDLEYDYHLCMSVNTCEVSGDWVPVRRVPFYSGSYQYQNESGNMVYSDMRYCIENATRCSEPAEIWALNWRTGELIPWDTFVMPTATSFAPTLATSPFQGETPIYTDPERGVSFYAGEDRNNLWCVPSEGTPVRWVNNGSAFTYIP